MDGMFGNANHRCRPFEQFNLPRLPDRRSQSQTNDIFLFAPPETGHQQDASANPSFAKRNRLIQRSHTKPARSLLLQRPRAFNRPVSIGIRFHDGANLDPTADVLLHCAKVLPQGSQRNFGPGRPSRGSLNDFDSSHCF